MKTETKTTDNKRNAAAYAMVSLKGIAMGAADVVPGVSGGTIAFITGIYEELLDSIKSINPKALKTLFSEGIGAFWRHINGTFLLMLFMGIGISILSLARLLQFLLENYPVLVWSFFFGLIIASAIYVAKKITRWRAATIVAMVAGAVVAFFITTITPSVSSGDTPLWFVFTSGAIAICAMILPGISGSFILLLLGQYKYIITSLNEMKLVVIAVFGGGAVVGLLAFSNVLSWLLKKFHNITVAVLVGFMIGALNKVWPWKEVTETFTDRHGEIQPLVEANVLPGTYETVTGNSAALLPAIAIAFVGFAIIFVIERIARGPANQQPKTV